MSAHAQPNDLPRRRFGKLTLGAIVGFATGGHTTGTFATEAVLSSEFVLRVEAEREAEELVIRLYITSLTLPRYFRFSRDVLVSLDTDANTDTNLQPVYVVSSAPGYFNSRATHQGGMLELPIGQEVFAGTWVASFPSESPGGELRVSIDAQFEDWERELWFDTTVRTEITAAPIPVI